ncbi:hypothetical protein H9N25_21830 [Pedobacter riviphilus]|uniref:TolB-like 6-blade propeller-like n=1 Tax=Pedobacter riviphilus TaxID=2766984 RepID=A0ABX6TG74_9SPHI|nr:hypothetical protein [Pedobacter riviphilus]QNR84509.1 hypothetical protein H9N25_21830 [Pedobacter riviphilus]
MPTSNIIAEKYPNLYLVYLQHLELYYATSANQQEYIINTDGDIIYELPKSSHSANYWTHFSGRSLDKLEIEFNNKINYWIETKFAGSGASAKIFSYKNAQLVCLLENDLILNATPLSPVKLLLHIAIDKSAPFSLTRICIYDTQKNECKEILTTNYKEDPFFVHRVFGLNYLFSVFIEKVNDKTGDYDHEIFWLYSHEGERLVNFDTTIGQNGEKTWFEPGKRGLGITYKVLDKPFKLSSSWYHSNYDVCNVLLDCAGNCFGDFYHIAGQFPSVIGKSSTRYPKYLDKRLLCLGLPDHETSLPYLVIIDENNNQIRTKYQYPWIFAFSSNAIIKDKKIFGKTCLAVINNDNDVKLIDLDGNEIKNVRPIKFKSMTVNYAKLFTLQVK